MHDMKCMRSILLHKEFVIFSYLSLGNRELDFSLCKSFLTCIHLLGCPSNFRVNEKEVLVWGFRQYLACFLWEVCWEINIMVYRVEG